MIIIYVNRYASSHEVHIMNQLIVVFSIYYYYTSIKYIIYKYYLLYCSDILIIDIDLLQYCTTDLDVYLRTHSSSRSFCDASNKNLTIIIQNIIVYSVCYVIDFVITSRRVITDVEHEQLLLRTTQTINFNNNNNILVGT